MTTGALPNLQGFENLGGFHNVPGKLEIMRILTLFSILFLLACQKSEYHQLVTAELASGKRHDDIFLDVHFGMPAKEFYDHCWKLNKEGVLRQSNQNNAVYFAVDSTLTEHQIDINFYPNFSEDGKIVEMPCLVNYRNWTPWDKDMEGDDLVEDTRDLFAQWYDGEFIKLERAGKLPAWVKVDGNRRTVITKRDENTAKVVITDLTAEVGEDTRAKGLK